MTVKKLKPSEFGVSFWCEIFKPNEKLKPNELGVSLVSFKNLILFPKSTKKEMG
jgi:hypothetical protein